MAKLTLADVTSLSNTASAKQVLNDNFAAIEAAVENTLSRDGATPNAMAADIDMGDNTILNVADPVAGGDAVNLRSLTPLVQDIVGDIAELFIEGTARLLVFTATAGQVDFVLPSSPGTTLNMTVHDNKIHMTPDVDFTLTGASKNTLSFFTGRALNSEIVVRYTELAPTDSQLRADLANEITGGAAIIAYKRSSVDAILEDVDDMLDRLSFSPDEFTGASDDVKINRALQAAKLSGVREVLLQERDYTLKNKISIPSGVSLVGTGSGQYPLSMFTESANFIATPKTRLLADSTFPALTPMVEASVTRGDQYTLHAVELRGMMIDCANEADIGLKLRGIKNSRVHDVLIFRPTATVNSMGCLLDTAQGAITGATAQAGTASTITLAAASGTRDDWYNGATITITAGTGSGQSRTITDYVGATKVATVNTNWSPAPNGTSVYDITGEVLEGNGATQFNDISQLSIWLGATGKAAGMVFDGDGVHDVNQNSYSNLKIVHADGPGMRFYNGDTDYFHGVSTFAFGNGWGAEMYGSETTNYEGYCRNEFFLSSLFGGNNVGADSGTAQTGAGLTITLRVGANATDDYYNGKFVTITGGTGAGQRRKIADYTGASKVALVSEAWTTAPDNTSTYEINKGGGVALYKGVYRTSRYHMFTNLQSVTNGAGEIFAEDGGIYTHTTEIHSDLNEGSGYNLNLGNSNAFVGGTGARLNFRRKLLGMPAEMASIREVTSGTEGASTGALAMFTRKAGAAPTETFRVSSGININGGTELKKLLRVAASIDFGSIPANSFLNAPSTITVTGAATGDQVLLGLPSTGVANGLAFKAWVSAADTVTVQALNVTAGAIDPGNLSFAISVFGW